MIFRLHFEVIFVVVALGALASEETTDPRRRRLHRSNDGEDCTQMKPSFDRLFGHESHAMPPKKIHDDKLEICLGVGQHRSCCTRLMEHRLHQAAMDYTRSLIASNSPHLKPLLLMNSKLYQNEFLKLLSLSNNATKSLLIWTYKLPEDDVNRLVDKLFENLHNYMDNENEDIGESVTNFFDSLFSSIFIYIISDVDGALVPLEQKTCIRNARKELVPSPFSEALQKLIQDLVQSFGVARSLLNAFDLAAKVINTTDHLHFEHLCSRSLTRLLYCSHCEGFSDLRPCRNFCMNVMHGCLAEVREMSLHWDLFINAVEKLVLSMRGSFDIQDVMRRFHIRISDSIMHVMETTQKYHSQIVSKCGHLTVHSMSMPTRGSEQQPPRHLPQIHDVKLHQKIEMSVRNLAESKGYYSKLPDALCSSEELSAGNYDLCWNGTSLGTYLKPVPAQEFSVQVAENPEMRISESKQMVIVNLSEQLDNTTKILHSRIIPKLPLMQSDERIQEYYYSSGSGDDNEDDIDSGSSSGFETDDPSVKPTKPSGKDRITVADGGDVIVHITNTDFSFIDRTTSSSQSAYLTKSKSDHVTIKSGAGSILQSSCVGSLLAAFSIFTFTRASC